jgi:hypothetical protein
MTDADSRTFVAECFWPGVREDDLRALDERAAAKAQEVTDHGGAVWYLGSVLMREDEVVLCRFRGATEAVTQAALAADIPFTRILETAQSPWPRSRAD